jgi:alkaline phosphatase D
MKLLLASVLLVFSLHLSAQESYVLLVSFDGFRYDHAEHYKLPHFLQLAKEGATAPFMRPSYPSKTFPNHYTLVTGLYPGNHGLVDNAFYDREKQVFYRTNNRDIVEDASFYGGTPIWQHAQNNGLRSASYFWVGSEAPVQGKYPDIYKIYDHDFPNDQRIDSVFSWFALPKKERPNIVTLYFSIVDSESHDFGPNSEENHQTLLEADRLLGRLMEGIQQSGLPINLIVVSDHGMYEMKYDVDTYIDLGDLITFPRDAVKMSNSETHIHLYVNDPDDTGWIYDRLKSQEKNYKVYLRDEIPALWHYSSNPRIGDLLLVAGPGHAFRVASRNETYGTHGFDPYTVPEMGAIFYAWGPNIKPGSSVPGFQNIHVFPFMCRILGIEPPECDGDVAVLEPLLK